MKSSVTTATSSSTPSATNGSPTHTGTSADTKKLSKNRAVINTSGITKYLGQDDKKVVVARKDMEGTKERKGLLGINGIHVNVSFALVVHLRK